MNEYKIELRSPKVINLMDDTYLKKEVINYWIRSRNTSNIGGINLIEISDEVFPQYRNIGELNWCSESEFIDRLLKTDIQFLDLVELKFEVQSSIIFRDIMYSFNINKWAVSHRLAKYRDYYISSEYTDYYDSITTKIHAFHKESIIPNNFDLARYKLPYQLSTNFWFSCNLRTLARILYTIKYYTPDLFEIYGTKFLESCEVLKRYFELNGDKLRYCDEIHQVGTKSPYKADLRYYEMGLVFYSQFIRQSNTLFITGIYGSILCKITKSSNFIESTYDMQGDTVVKVGVLQSESKFLSTIRNRTHWFAMTDDWGSINSWSCILQNYISDNKSVKEMIPYLKYFDLDTLELNKEVYSEDTVFRVLGKEKEFLPDAILCEARYLAVERDRICSNPLNRLYIRLFDEGYVQDNPNNPYRIYYESNVRNK